MRFDPTPDPSYEPNYVYWPQKEVEIECELSPAEYAAVRTLVESDRRMTMRMRSDELSWSGT